MSAPKSVVKISHKKANYGEVTFTSNVDRVQYTLEELTKAALRDTGRVLIDKVREATPVKTGLLKKSWQKWVRKNKGNGEQSLSLGVYSADQAKKKNQPFAYHAHLVLLGHKTVNGDFVPGNNFFYQVVADNLSLIRDVQGQYLSAIADEQKAIKIAEAEEAKAEDDD